MCQYCDEKSLPCLMCGRACMEYQLDRSRCRGCATHNQPPHTWPVFTHCPYCGRDLSKKQLDRVTKKLENKIRTIAEMAEYIYGGFEE